MNNLRNRPFRRRTLRMYKVLRHDVVQHLAFWVSLLALIIAYLFLEKETSKARIILNALTLVVLLIIPVYFCYWIIFKRFFKGIFLPPLLNHRQVRGWGGLVFLISSLVVSLLFGFLYFHYFTPFFEAFDFNQGIFTAFIWFIAFFIVVTSDKKDHIETRRHLERIKRQLDSKKYSSSGTINYIELTIERRIRRILFDDILMIEADRNNCKISTLNEELPLVTRIGIGKIKEALPDNFLQIHRAFLVNMDYLVSYTRKCKDLEINGLEGLIPVSENFRATVSAYLGIQEEEEMEED